MSYRKEIKITDTGMVVASVYCVEDSRRTGLKFFHAIWDNQKKRCKKAHDWADNHIKICEEQEVL